MFGLTWQWQTFDFNKNVDQVDQVLAADLNAVNTDLRPFSQRGGKLILYAGWADPLIPSVITINYYNAMTQTMTGSQSSRAIEQTQSFSRVFMAPGMWHCTGGPGPNSFGGAIQEPAPAFDPQHDLLSALTQWVEKGIAPTSVVATKYVGDTPKLGIQMQRPLCAYPKVSKYNGGDPNIPSSFSCVADDRDPIEIPAPQYGP